MLDREVDGIVRFRSEFRQRLKRGDGEVQVIVHGTDANTARIIEAYAQGVVGAMEPAAGGRRPAGRRASGRSILQSRVWFNEAGESSYFSCPA